MSMTIGVNYSNYYFDIEPEGLKPVLTVFIEIFLLVKPFDLNQLGIDSHKFRFEYKKIVYNHNNDDGTSINHIINNIISGNESNLNDQKLSLGNTQDILNQMNKLFGEYYIGSNMKIVLISHYSINKLRSLAYDLFNQFPIVNRKNNPVNYISQIQLKDLNLTKLIMFTSSSIIKPKLTLTFFTGELNMNKISVIEYYIYMLKGTIPGSLSYDLFRR